MANLDVETRPSEAAGDLSDRFKIDDKRPLPELDSPGAKAYAANAVQATGNYFALICELTMPVRFDVLTAMGGGKITHTLCAVDSGPVHWPPAGRRLFCIIFERPAGGRLARIGEPIAPWSEAQLINDLIGPVARCLSELETEGITHRSIRPNNIFYRDGGRRQLILGDCITTVPALHQPAIFEPIEGMMVAPDARSLGSTIDDVYALGVTVVTLMRGSIPGAGIPEEQLLRAKLREGSFETITRGMEINPLMTAFLRGVLSDNPPARWGVADVKDWVAGRPPARRNAPPLPAPMRRLEFLGEQIPHMRMLGYVLAGMEADAAGMIRDKSLEGWLVRAFGSRDGAIFVTGAVGGSGDHAPTDDGLDPWLVARVCTALDPYAPIRYRGRAIAPDAIGNAIALAMLKGINARPIAEMLTYRLPAFWLTQQKPAPPGIQAAIFAYDPVKRMVDNDAIGFGMERVLYELMPGVRCLSPLVEAAYVIDPAKLLPALEAAAKEGRVSGLPIDRHIAAFIGAHAPGRLDDVLAGLTHQGAAERGLATLRLLVALKGAAMTPSLPRLTQMLAVETKSLLERVHNRELRNRLQGRLGDVAAGGNLSDLLKLVNDPAGLRQDASRFQRARYEFRSTFQQVERVRRALSEIGPRSEKMADLIGYWMCMALAIMVISVTIVLWRSH